MKLKFFSVVTIVSAMMFTACDETTDTIGTSLTDKMDMLEVSTDTFELTSKSVVVDSVLSRNTTGYLGKIKDPETGNYITCDFMAQFGTLEDYELPEIDSIASLSEAFNENDSREDMINKIVADSCHIRLFYTSYYGDSLATMNMTAYEMSKPMEENKKYYSNFDPKEEYVGNDGMKINKTYTLVDLSISDDERADESSYTSNIKINLNQPYTDKNGKTYNNFGTYIMRKYYENPEYFKNSYNFIHNVCPGFYFEINDGLGSMAYVSVSQLNIYFKYKNDSTYIGTSTFAGTEEVLQTTNIVNDDKSLDNLAEDNTCTYLKTPSGIFTELTLPVDEVRRGHENDTLNTAKLVLTRLNNKTHSEYALDVPTTLLMIPSDSINSFFENEDIVDYQRSFIATYDGASSSSAHNYNTYTFDNISGMISSMYNAKNTGLADNPNWIDEHENWNKVVIIPVSVTTNSSSQIVKVVHDMSLTSTRLVGGSANPNAPITLTVVYSKFNHNDGR